MLQTAPRPLINLRTNAPIVKICGITKPEHALVAANNGADMIGLVFAPSKRQVSPQVARDICQALRALGALGALGGQEAAVMVAGVFVNETPQRIREIADYVGLDVAQLSGDESCADIVECARFSPVIRAIRFPQGASFDEASRLLDGCKSLNLNNLQLLVDAYHPGAYGGTGRAADWTLAARLAVHDNIILAGGLNPSNVAEAIQTVAPYGVDVSSGVEIEGTKKPGLIKDFIRAAKGNQ